MSFDLNADWREVCTLTRFKREFPNFKFEGVGWYFTKDGDTLLVEEVAEPSAKVRAPGDTSPVFTFSVWNSRNPFEVFGRLIAMPVRSLK